MESPLDSKLINAQVSTEKRRTLEIEYGAALNMLQMLNSQIWHTFAVVSTLALAGLAFVGQFKANATGKVTWLTSVTVGLAMVTILLGWLALANRWWAYALIQFHRMAEIETKLGMYLIRETFWVRNHTKLQVDELNDEERVHYESIHKSFSEFPKYRWRQNVLTTIIVGALILIWLLFMIADVFSLV